MERRMDREKNGWKEGWIERRMDGEQEGDRLWELNEQKCDAEMIGWLNYHIKTQKQNGLLTLKP